MPSETVKVIVRVRPMNEREKNKQCTNIVQVDEPNMQLTLVNPTEADTQKVFSYDAVFGMNSAQQTLYEDAAFPLVESVIEGYNGTIFAYGQTGCGKTHTMLGVPNDENLKGVIPRAFDHIFGSIESSGKKKYLIRCSYIEIYNEEIHDLIGEDVRTKLDLKESNDKGIFIKNLSMHVVKSVPEIQKLMSLGSKNRSVGETAMNKDSSRSHSIFTIYVESSETDEQGNTRITLGKLNLVDLAGSERQSKTGATGDRLKEANKINLSLSALGNVISALVDGKSSHIPYRDSKLTRLLQDSLGGNTKTVMVANVSPASDNYDETLGTLRYASRAKNIKNQPKVNEDPKDAMLREYAEEIQRLKMLLENGGSGGSGGNGGNSGAGYAKKSIGELDSADNRKLKKGDSSTTNHYESQLKQKMDEINEEKNKREELEAKLKMMQEQLVNGGGAKPQVNQAEKKKYQQMAKKLKEQNQQHEDLLREKMQKEEEMLEVENKYADLQEEVVEQRKIIKRLRKKYKEAMGEIKDLARENELNKEDLLDTIRLLERDVKINNAIMMYLLSPEELDKIRSRARWHDDRNEFVVPPFVVRAKKVKFPKIGGAQGMEMVREEWENRDLEFVSHKENYRSDDYEDEYGEDQDWQEERTPTTAGKMYDNSPAVRGKNFETKNKYSSKTPIMNNARSDFNSHGTQNFGFETKNAMSKHLSKDSLDKGFNVRSSMNKPETSQKKGQPRNVQLDPINVNQLSTDKPLKPLGGPVGNVGNNMAFNSGNLPPMKGKVQLQPINPPGLNNQRSMKLSFKATLLINNDGSNAELQAMSSHVKGY